MTCGTPRRNSRGPPGERMIHKRAIKRDEPQIFDGALRQQQTIEWVARGRLRNDGCQGMTKVDAEEIKAYPSKIDRKIFEGPGQIEPSEPELDGHFP
jgi:hypothetical protein